MPPRIAVSLPPDTTMSSAIVARGEGAADRCTPWQLDTEPLPTAFT